MITVKEEAEKFKEQAEKDWETILLARAKELAPGKNYNTSFALVHFGPSLCHATLRSRDRERVRNGLALLLLLLLLLLFKVNFARSYKNRLIPLKRTIEQRTESSPWLEHINSCQTMTANSMTISDLLRLFSAHLSLA